MYLRRVVLENVRGFDQLDFRFDRSSGTPAGWTVITGENGSGKTALLKAIALALVGPDAARVLQPSLKGWIRNGCTEAVIALEITADETDRFSQGLPYQQPFWAEWHLSVHEGPRVALRTGTKYRGKGKGPTHGPWADNPMGWFCAGYGPFRRLYGASAEATRIMSGPGRVARFATMFKEDATLIKCEEWLKDLRHKEHEGRSREKQILDQVQQLLRDDFLRNDMTVERVDSEGLWLRDAQGVVLPLTDMSEGYRSALAMLVDLVRHMVSVYGPEDLIEKRNEHFVVSRPGVVLIDEMDSHLHPDWQRQIGFWFKERFPNIQFIVTTHSAFVCQAADVDGIFYLPTPGDDTQPSKIPVSEYRKIVKSKPDAIYLSPAFGMRYTRSDPVVSARREYAELRSKQSATPLTPGEQGRLEQLSLFADEE